MAENNMGSPSWTPHTPYVALGERWGQESRGSWVDGLRPFNWEIGQWGIWPFQVPNDDLLRISDGRFNVNHPSPSPYVKAGGLMLSSSGDNGIICEGRVTGIEYQHSDQVALTLEMDEV